MRTSLKYLRPLFPLFADAAHIVDLVRDADYLFIEAAFLQAEAERAAHTYHLTAHQAGLLAREAGVKFLVPFHFSARCQGRGRELHDEAMAAFKGAGSICSR